MDTTTQHPPHVVLIPSPGMGHLIPLVELSKLLHFNHHFSTTLLLPTSSSPTTAVTTFLSTLPSTISYTFLPPIDPTLLPTNPNSSHSVIIHLIHSHSLPYFRSALASLSNVVAVVTDLFGTDYFDVARELSIPPYMYFTTNAFCMAFLLHLPELDQKVTCPYQELKEPLILHGCVPLQGKDFDEPTLDRQGESYKVLLYHVKRYYLADGILINSLYDLEPGPLHGLCTNGLIGFYPVGPIIQTGSVDVVMEMKCLSWLDRHPHGSVLYVSFGSGGTLSYEQTNELAIGLEKSGQRFLWVVRSPNNNDSSGSFFNAQNQDDYTLFDFLPNGFIDKVKDRGLLVPFWAPQIKVLAHKSIGGFVSHCGWNSILESVVNGVPLIAWPLYAEQRMNAVMLNEGLKVALRPKENERGLVEAAEVANVVCELFEGGEGMEARRRMKELSDGARKARGDDGDSTKMLSQVALKWCQGKKLGGETPELDY